MDITIFYLSLLSLIYVWLSLQVIKKRRLTKVSVLDGDNQSLIYVLRAHGNFYEYSIFFILLLGSIEFNGAPNMIVHIIALSFLFGRVLHAYAFYNNPTSKYRVWGMQLTLWPLLLLAIGNLLYLFTN